ncbi:hypothetical protein [Chitiniphilus eburneus]|uniref:Uncharacterized protein n=1 Tax=Chitiniphilus eburneus TaxID=2571148 RepID=A0A4U0PZF0_9NEIS|nr:hypothetical protein [Chitiniphilus eburneus]TJZ74063.1 hypothetical protein FAZ21_08895 [Chitiniphilus eburneus]
MPVQALAHSNQPQQQYAVPPRAAQRSGAFSGILAEMLTTDAAPMHAEPHRSPENAGRALAGGTSDDGSTRQWLMQRQAQDSAPSQTPSPRAAKGYDATMSAGGARIDLRA